MRSVCQRLAFGGRETELALDAAALFRSARVWSRWPPSKLTVKLDGISAAAIQTAYVALPPGKARRLLENYLDTWRHVRPHTTGSDLQDLGLKPGPRYRTILEALRAAWIDGKVNNEQGERALLEQLLRGAPSGRS
jgi:tRNA nucleotidyltransferase (CCA-adding enzyme)